MEDLKLLEHLSDLVGLVMKIRKEKKKCGVRKINRDRQKNGYYQVVFIPMKMHDPEQFFINCRMNSERFDFLLSLIKPRIQKKSIRKPVSPKCRLAVVLSYLSQGVSIQYLAWSYKLGKETVRQIILDTCEEIWQTLQPLYVSEPISSDFEQISHDFNELWNLPHCVGSIDGKHIAIVKPKNSGALFYNYKHFYSIVLLAACDARYMFTFVDIGGYGGNSDGGLFANSKFGKKILKQELPLPAAEPLPNSSVVAPAYFVADAAFPLGMQLMKPFPGHNLSEQKEKFNKRICRGRQTIENTFGILAARWRILMNTIHMEPANCEKVVLACVALHNFIMMDNFSRNHSYCPREYCDWIDDNGMEHLGEWRQEGQTLHSIRPSSSQHRFNGSNALELRNTLCNYFNS